MSEQTATRASGEAGHPVTPSPRHPVNSSPRGPVRTIEWIGDVDGHVRLIDQTLLPTRLEYRDCKKVEEVWEAIKVLRVRGAPAIGVAAGYGVVLGMQGCSEKREGYRARLREVAGYLRTSR